LCCVDIRGKKRRARRAEERELGRRGVREEGSKWRGENEGKERKT